MNLRSGIASDGYSTADGRAPATVYALTVFVGAFLLFQVQPLIGKYVLPWYGGSPEVWTVCMLLFQVLLLGGYAYAHLSVSYLPPRGQVILHVALITCALVLLPITPSAWWKPQSSSNPTLQILVLLVASIGLPYFVLSATGPLLQGWFSRIAGGRPPYGLYALSNAGSLIALVSYPFLVEPAFGRQVQAQGWSAGMGVFALLCSLSAARLWRQASGANPQVSQADTPWTDAAPPSLPTRLLWLALPAGASVELLAVTNKICQDVAAVPFLWVLPLALYLLSFVVCFHHQRWYVRPVFLVAFILSIIGLCVGRTFARDLSATWQIFIYCAALLACCMVCHGELYRLRPHPRHLTGYYLMIALGGAIGGFFVAVVAPLVFKTYHELYFGLLACCLFVLLADKSPSLRSRPRRVTWVGLILIFGTVAIILQGQRGGLHERAVLTTRDFFGMLTVWENDREDPAKHRYVLQHGTTFHGLQFVDPARRLEPTAYYGRTSGAGLAMRLFPRQGQRRIGVVGLGVGTLAAYGRQGDYFRFYEINPQVKRLAETRFSYLASCPAKVDVIMGDARLSMEREPAEQFDLLILDAFTSDAVPVHLLTKEAFETYLRHLKGDGVIAAHVSTIHVDLKPVILRLAHHFKLKAIWIEDEQNKARGIFASDWILLTGNDSFLQQKAVRAASSPLEDVRRVGEWTDDRVNLLQVLR
jgi:spermidine synthase